MKFPLIICCLFSYKPTLKLSARHFKVDKGCISVMAGRQRLLDEIFNNLSRDDGFFSVGASDHNKPNVTHDG
jgi:hypothetical protein